jgi:hypothetical protein
MTAPRIARTEAPNFGLPEELLKAMRQFARSWAPMIKALEKD